ncbi:hypothetical protein BCV71DRAFT_236832 [Rhizopus microsporus]|uniref:Uncharacterized protein n=1 Tax=Rhizopus microsporus TaxID=58291 RepID=A0A1X0RWG1_RHIZD|nr:hypothetical protein BCV71DRAFT_236832 [Rhizopus microsporus]
MFAMIHYMPVHNIDTPEHLLIKNSTIQIHKGAVIVPSVILYDSNSDSKLYLPKVLILSLICISSFAYAKHSCQTLIVSYFGLLQTAIPHRHINPSLNALDTDQPLPEYMASLSAFIRALSGHFTIQVLLQYDQFSTSTTVTSDSGVMSNLIYAKFAKYNGLPRFQHPDN